jgi:hypothetical protein
MSPNSKVWFPAKRYGWGWGLPLGWQGWAVYVGFIVLIVVGLRSIVPQKHPALWFGYLVWLAALLFSICLWKGEKPQWRWGHR